MQFSYQVDSLNNETWESSCGRFRITRLPMAFDNYWVEDLLMGTTGDYSDLDAAKQMARDIAREDAERIQEFTQGIVDLDIPAIVEKT